MRKNIYFCLILFLLLLPAQSVSAADKDNPALQAQSEESSESGASSRSSTADTKNRQTKSPTDDAEARSSAQKTDTAASDQQTSATAAAKSETDERCVITVSAGNGQLVLQDGTALSGTHGTGSDLTAILLPDRGYTIPESIQITAAGAVLDASDYSYSGETGVLTLPAEVLGDELSIGFSCVILPPVMTVSNGATTKAETVYAVPNRTASEGAQVSAARTGATDDETAAQARDLHAIYLLSALFCAGGALYLLLFIVYRARREGRLYPGRKTKIHKAEA